MPDTAVPTWKACRRDSEVRPAVLLACDLEHLLSKDTEEGYLVIKELSGLPRGVIGFEATGTLSAEDYRDVILLVTDIEWMNLMTTFFGWLTPGEVRHFPPAQREEAIAWAAG